MSMLRMENLNLNLINDYQRIKEVTYSLVDRRVVDLESYGVLYAALEAERFKGEEIILVFIKYGVLTAIEVTKHDFVEWVSAPIPGGGSDVDENWVELNKFIERLERKRSDLELI